MLFVVPCNSLVSAHTKHIVWPRAQYSITCAHHTKHINSVYPQNASQ